MPLGRAWGKAKWLAEIKVNKGLILGAVPKPARVRSQQPARRGSGVAARVQETGEAKGRDRGVNSAPVVLQQPQREGSCPPFVFLLCSSLATSPLQAALAAARVAAYFDKTLGEAR
jgi:hypothetical protein